jgi:hypothetical protein
MSPNGSQYLTLAGLRFTRRLEDAVFTAMTRLGGHKIGHSEMG